MVAEDAGERRTQERVEQECGVRAERRGCGRGRSEASGDEPGREGEEQEHDQDDDPLRHGASGSMENG